MRPTCTDCALKHLSQASILLSEFHQGYPTHIFYALGHMAEAGDELVKEYPKHAEMVRAERKKLEEDPNYAPDFNQLLEKIDKECEVCSLANPGKKHNPGNPGPRREYKPSSWTKCELQYPSVQLKIASCAREIEKRQTCPPSKWGTSPTCVNPYAVCRASIRCPPNPGNPGVPGNPSEYMQRGQTLPARQMWLLREMCRRRGIDTKLIDPGIDYWENKEEIEREARVRLRLKPRNNNDLRSPVVKNNEGRAVAALLQQREREEEEAYEEYARAFKVNH